jgi:hypothetical protein
LQATDSCPSLQPRLTQHARYGEPWARQVFRSAGLRAVFSSSTRQAQIEGDPESVQLAIHMFIRILHWPTVVLAGGWEAIRALKLLGWHEQSLEGELPPNLLHR